MSSRRLRKKIMRYSAEVTNVFDVTWILEDKYEWYSFIAKANYLCVVFSKSWIIFILKIPCDLKLLTDNLDWM